jgi:hypothetical protein
VRYLTCLQGRRRSAAQLPTDVIGAQRLAWRAERSLARLRRPAAPEMAQSIHQHLRVNPRRNLTIEEFADANAFRPISYVAHLWGMISKTTYGVRGRRKSLSLHHLYRDGGI